MHQLMRMLFEDESKAIFEQDHASTHFAHDVMDFLDQKGVTVISDDTPAKMDDVWCIERLWGILHIMIFKRPEPKTYEELERRTTAAWKSVEVDTCKVLIHGMRSRIRKIVQLEGRKLTNHDKLTE